MTSNAITVNQYLSELPPDRQAVMEKLRKLFKKHLPKGFAETMNYGMIGYVVPHSIYPAGYHCNPNLPLPFIAIAAQKNFYAIYHMGIYASDTVLAWFKEAYAELDCGKLDMGKSCIRFKNPDKIPYELLADLAQKFSVEDWIGLYEQSFTKKTEAKK
jgi:uncharacterized protein YdhG (YjbR/CyaY superfamily)